MVLAAWAVNGRSLVPDQEDYGRPVVVVLLLLVAVVASRDQVSGLSSFLLSWRSTLFTPAAVPVHGALTPNPQHYNDVLGERNDPKFRY